VEKLRDEAASHRVTAKERADALARYEFLNDLPDEARDTVLGAFEGFVTDPEGSGSVGMVQILRRVLGDRFDDVLEESKAPQYLTREQAEEVARSEADKREEARQLQAAKDSLAKQVSDLGFEEGSPETALLYWSANTKTDGDLTKAAEEVKAYRQSVIDAYVAGKRDSNNAFPPVSGARVEGAAPPANEGPKTMDEAGDMLRALAAQQRQAAVAG
jgi:hypothetical protein